MKRTSLRPKEVEQVVAHFGMKFSKKDVVEMVEDATTVILLNKKPALFVVNGKYYPTLRYLVEHPCLKQIVVDMGAIKFIVNGADIMRPGIVELDETIAKDEAVMVVDVTHKKPLAVGIALLSGREMKEASSGKVIKNLHYVGDALWKMTV